MAQITDIIKYEGDNSTFIWKHPCEDFNSLITDKKAIEDFQFMLMDYGDDAKFFELYRSLTQVLNAKNPQRKKGKWE